MFHCLWQKVAKFLFRLIPQKNPFFFFEINDIKNYQKPCFDIFYEDYCLRKAGKQKYDI